MTNGETDRKPLRLWPGVVAVVLLWIFWVVVPRVLPEQGGAALLGMAICGVIVLLWWLFFSRAPWMERICAIVLMVLAVWATKYFVHKSIATGAMGYLLPLFSIPTMTLALVAWAVFTRNASSGVRRVWMVVITLIACASFLLIRTNGMSGEGTPDLDWRWTPTAEDRLLAETANRPVAARPPVETKKQQPETKQEPAETTHAPVAQTAPVEEPDDEPAAAVPESNTKTAASEEVETGIEWPGFRGAKRDSVIRGVRIVTDWNSSPPVEMWRQPVGPGWSSFAVHGDRFYTQEQRGEEELVSAYQLNTGEPIWSHSDAARFWESNAGAGPRATPTLNNGRVYTLGGTGILNALNASDGSVIWSRNAVSDTGKQVPMWGIASSPLLVGDIVIAATNGSLVGYDAATGKPRWFGPKEGGGYSSPHLSTIDGVQQVLLINGTGAISVTPSNGKVLWQHKWGNDGIVQPALIAGNDLLIGTGSGMAANNGMVRVSVVRNGNEWNLKERWTSIGLKPYFNDFVVHDGHAFGFDGSFLSCINLADGKRKWKGGRYGHGQLVLLADQGLLLVLSEKGELALVSAAADQFTELARVPAIQGKTWNHPVLAGDVLLVRNDREMAAFRISRAP